MTSMRSSRSGLEMIEPGKASSTSSVAAMPSSRGNPGFEKLLGIPSEDMALRLSGVEAIV